MPKLNSVVDPSSETFVRNAAHNRALVEDLRDKVAQAALGGPEATRQRHVARGKLLPRERVERLLDPGSPFLEIGQLAACDLYNGEAPGAGVITGIIDLTELMPDRRGLDPTDAVLNGIAWDPEGRRLFVTGKNWPKLFEIRLTGPR